MTGAIIGRDHLIFRGGGGKITLVLDFFLRAPEPGYFFCVVLSWIFFFSQDHAYNKNKNVYYTAALIVILR